MYYAYNPMRVNLDAWFSTLPWPYLKLFIKMCNTILMVLWAIGGNDSVYGVILRNHINQIKQINERDSDFSPISSWRFMRKSISSVHFFIYRIIRYICINDMITCLLNIIARWNNFSILSMMMKNESSKPLFIMESYLRDGLQAE